MPKQRDQRDAMAPPALPPGPTGNGLARSRMAVFRMAAALGIPLALLIGAEGLLRLSRIGYAPLFFQEAMVEGRSALIDNQSFGQRFFPPGLTRYPHPLAIPNPKEPGTTRVFVFGESAALGDPDGKFGMPRMLEVLLRARFPDQRIEVVTTAMVAINSHVVAQIAKECIRREGDVWIVYMGNNEMIGPFGATSVFGLRTPPLWFIRASLALKSTRLGQLSDAALRRFRPNPGLPTEWEGMSMMANLRTAADDPGTRRVHQYFRRNLRSIAEAGRAAKARVILSTVAVNLKECAPFGSVHRADLTKSDLEAWRALYNEGLALQEQGKFAEAGECYRRAADIDDRFADLAFRRGQCHSALANERGAQEHFRNARDLDALQFRADSRINATIRDFGVSGQGWDIELFDAEKHFADRSPGGVPGTNWFFEHVHLTPEGNYSLAKALAEEVAGSLGWAARTASQQNAKKDLSERMPQGTLSISTAALEPASPWLTDAECFARLGLTDWNRRELLKTIVGRMEKPPFTRQIGHEAQMRNLRDQLDRLRVASKPAQLGIAARQVESAVALNPTDADLRWNWAQILDVAGQAAKAEEQWRTVIRFRPHASLPYYNLARLLEQLGRNHEAEELYLRTVDLNPDYFEAEYSAGVLLIRSNRAAEATRCLRKSVKLRPNSTAARMALGVALIQLQKPSAARRQFQEILRLDPNHSLAREHLARLSQ